MARRTADRDILKVLNADFVTSAARADGIPRDDLPHIAMAGRSNVGKSSLINALCRARIARTSAAPGKTRLANFYRVLVEGGRGGPGTWGLYLVDLPGYGYARGGAEAAGDLARVAEDYFKGSPSTTGVLLLVDARHPGLQADLDAASWLARMNTAVTLAATKVDKLSRNERHRNLKVLETKFGMPALPISAASGEGLDELWRTIARLARPGQ